MVIKNNTINCRRWRETNPEKYKASLARWKITHKYERIITRLKHSAKKRGLSFSLTVEQLQKIPIPTVCPVLGIPLHNGVKYICDNSPSLDRIDNKKGYDISNVVWVSWRANKLKHCATFEEMEKIYNFYKQKSEGLTCI